MNRIATMFVPLATALVWTMSAAALAAAPRSAAPLVSPRTVAPAGRMSTKTRSGARYHPPLTTGPMRRVAWANRAATLEPARDSYVNAVQIYPFSEGAIYRVYTAPERVTDIALEPGEALGAVAAGDTVRWVIGDTTSGGGEAKRSHVLVKPIASGLSTSLLITTDRRAYHLLLTSTAGTAMAALSWSYPQDALIGLRKVATQAQAAQPVAAGLQVDQLHFNYVISGDQPAWRPLRAFDDGRQTFIEFPASLATNQAPPLFLVDAKGQAQLVNYRVQGRYYIVDRIFDAAELRLGLKHQDVVRVSRGAADDAHGRAS